MSWRFRKTFKVLPGVKLNLTRHGLSATLGAAPFSVNVGPRGVYRNLSIPGTGLSSRERLVIPSSQPSRYQPQPTEQGVSPSPLAFVPPVPSVPSRSRATEIRSASTKLLNSQSMDSVRKLLQEAYEERDALIQEISKGSRESTLATQRYQNWERGFLFRRMFTIRPRPSWRSYRSNSGSQHWRRKSTLNGNRQNPTTRCATISPHFRNVRRYGIR